MKQQAAPTKKSVMDFLGAHRKAITITVITIIALLSIVSAFVNATLDESYGNEYKPGYINMSIATSAKDKQTFVKSDYTLDALGDFSAQYNAPQNDTLSAILDNMIEGTKMLTCRIANTADDCENLFGPQPILITVTSATPIGKVAGTYNCEASLLQVASEQISAETKQVRPIICSITYKD